MSAKRQEVPAATIARLEVTPDPANEAEFRTALVKLLRARGWLVTFNQPARPGRRAGRAYMTMGTPGYPDLTCLRPPDLVFLECKMIGNSATADQRMWLNGLAAVDGSVQAWEVNVGHWPILVRLAEHGLRSLTTEQETM